MIDIKNVSFSYDNTRLILHDVSVCFSQGKTYSVFGPSGSGKSTLLALLGGVVAPTKGEIWINGQNIADFESTLIRRTLVSYIFQDYLLFPFLTAQENVEIAYGICKPQEKKAVEKATLLLSELGIDGSLLRKQVRYLSGGEQQRVGIARALVTGNPILLADEPTGNLDKATANDVMQLLIKLTKEYNKCCIIVTHSEMIRSQTDCSFLLDDGCLKQVDSK